MKHFFVNNNKAIFFYSGTTFDFSDHMSNEKEREMFFVFFYFKNVPIFIIDWLFLLDQS